MQALRNFRTYFLRGLAALLPTIVTIWIFVQCYIFIQDKVSVYINRALVKLILWNTDQWSETFLIGFWVEGKGKHAGFFLAIIGVCFIGAFVASVMGRTLYHIFEKALMRIPLIKKIYPYIRQITDFLLANRQISFTKVVALQYPRKGTWSIGLVTGSGLKRIADSVEKDFLTVFVPTSPTPFTGYVIITPREETMDLDMTIEEALRFTISGGVITPAQHEAFQALANKAPEKV